jgi:hypothetical protein
MIAMVCQQLGQGFFCVPCIHIANVQNAHAKIVFVLGISFVFPPFEDWDACPITGWNPGCPTCFFSHYLSVGERKLENALAEVS